MTFSFDNYYRTLFVWPLINILVFGFLLITLLYIAYIQLIRSKFSYKKLLIILVVGILMSYIFAQAVQNSNLQIWKDKDSTPLVIEGVIDDVSKTNDTTKHNYNGEVVWGRVITIDNKEYYIATNGWFNEGDEVTIEYLPNSKVVVSIELVTE